MPGWGSNDPQVLGYSTVRLTRQGELYWNGLGTTTNQIEQYAHQASRLPEPHRIKLRIEAGSECRMVAFTRTILSNDLCADGCSELAVGETPTGLTEQD